MRRRHTKAKEQVERFSQRSLEPKGGMRVSGSVAEIARRFAIPLVIILAFLASLTPSPSQPTEPERGRTAQTTAMEYGHYLTPENVVAITAALIENWHTEANNTGPWRSISMSVSVGEPPSAYPGMYEYSDTLSLTRWQTQDGQWHTSEEDPLHNGVAVDSQNFLQSVYENVDQINHLGLGRTMELDLEGLTAQQRAQLVEAVQAMGVSPRGPDSLRMVKAVQYFSYDEVPRGQLGLTYSFVLIEFYFSSNSGSPPYYWTIAKTRNQQDDRYAPPRFSIWRGSNRMIVAASEVPQIFADVFRELEHLVL